MPGRRRQSRRRQQQQQQQDVAIRLVGGDSEMYCSQPGEQQERHRALSSQVACEKESPGPRQSSLDCNTSLADEKACLIDKSPALARYELQHQRQHREDHNSGGPQAGCDCSRGADLAQARASSIQVTKMKGSSLVQQYANIRYLGVALFILASVFCLYKIYDLNYGPHADAQRQAAAAYSTHLKLVSVFNRHGDRGPSDSLPPTDGHLARAKLFWPNGLSNLTDAGRMRQFRLGLALRSRYESILDYNASHFLALSSPIARCQESIRETLRGLFDIENSPAKSLNFFERYQIDQGQAGKFCFRDDDLVHNETYCSAQASTDHKAGGSGTLVAGDRHRISLPGGSGYPNEYKSIQIDLKAVPPLTWEYLTACRWRRENPTPVDDNLMNSKAVAQLKGVNKLIKLLKARYELDFNFTALGLWSSVSAEIALSRTRETIGLSEHYADYINTPVPEYKRNKITLLDLWEQVAVLAYRDRIVGTANHIQFGPLLTSLIKSQKVALSHHQVRPPPIVGVIAPNDGNNKTTTTTTTTTGENRPVSGSGAHESVTGTFADGELYRGKRMIIYSSHDSILQQLMMNLSLINFEPENFEKRFNKWHRSDDANQLLAGLRMSRFGLSLVFELYETEMVRQGTAISSKSLGARPASPAKIKKFPFIQALLYNQADGKFKPVEYRRLKLGVACRKKFRTINESLVKAKVDLMLAEFYDADFPLDEEYSCPFQLFMKITDAYMMRPSELNKLCN